MSDHPPQPATDRITPFAGHPLVVGVEERVPEVLVRTAVSLAQATGAAKLYFAYADPARSVIEELSDGTVLHASLSPDALDDTWIARAADLTGRLGESLSEAGVAWEFRYLAGRPDRALTHLARAVDAAAIVVGGRAPGAGARLIEAVTGSVAVHLAHHQHRPVLTVPISVIDWHDTPSAWDQ
ncbi:MAG: universal stress protein [Propioniciclava sp.]|uniref:universal stress protein n=1 Tax=Propioniciclava sp. TaxID=2038686 RepID=UPI0039E675FB